MQITKEWLKSKSACVEGYEWSLKQEGFDTGIEVIKFLGMLVDAGHWDWANWVIVRVMTRPQYLAYAIYSAEQVIDIYEKKYSNDDRPRRAIDTAKKVLNNDTKENRNAATDAAYAAFAAYAATAVATDAAYAAYAAYAAANVATDAFDAADSAFAAYAATDAAAYAAERTTMRKKILNYGISLLEVKDE